MSSKKYFLLFVLIAIVVLVGASGIVTAGKGSPVSQFIKEALMPNPNLLAEDHVEISCEENFSIKVFTGQVLTDAEFRVFDDETDVLLFGPAAASLITPLWQSVPLGPLSSIPSRIRVEMNATATNRDHVSDELILEPDCHDHGSDNTTTNIVNNPIIINPWGKILVNPQPDPLQEEAVVPLPPLVMAVPKELVGTSIDTVVRRVPEGNVIGQGNLEIETEIISLQLTGGGITIPLNPPTPPHNEWHIDSFFDIIYEIDLGSDGTTDLTHPVRLIDARPLELGTEPTTETGHTIAN